MDDLDRRILTALQNDFPIAGRPYDSVAGKLGISVDALLERTRGLVEQGVIRRMGLSLDSRKLGYVSTLAAIRIGEDKVSRAAELIDGIEEITHCYERDDEYNVWFTIIAPEMGDIKRILARIQNELNLGEVDVLNLPATRLFKLDARFSPAGDDDDGE